MTVVCLSRCLTRITTIYHAGERKKEQSYDSSTGNRSFHSYNGLRGLFIVRFLQKKKFFFFNHDFFSVHIPTTLTSDINFWLFPPLKLSSSSPLYTKMCMQLQLYTSKAYTMQSGQRDAFRDVTLILIILPSLLSLWSVSCLPGKHQAESTPLTVTTPTSTPVCRHKHLKASSSAHFHTNKANLRCYLSATCSLINKHSVYDSGCYQHITDQSLFLNMKASNVHHPTLRPDL